MSDYKINARITADIEDFKKGMSEAQQKMQSIGTKMQSIGTKMQSIGTKMTAMITIPVLAAGTASVKMASDYEENLNKTEVAFGKAAQEVVNWSNTTVKQFGIANVTALDMASLFGDMATSMGLPQEAAAQMSMSMTGLAGDLASFKNMGLSEVQTALTGVFTGETESLKRLGIVMTQTNLDAFALANGFGKTTDAMTQAELVQLRYAYIMEMTKNAQGDYANTADGTANSARTFTETIKELGVTLGQILLPVITPIIQKLTDWVNKFKELNPGMQQTILIVLGIAAAIGPVLLILGSLAGAIGSIIALTNTWKLGEIAFNAVKQVSTAIQWAWNAALSANPIGLIILAIVAVIAVLVLLWNKSETFRNIVMGIINAIAGAFEWIKNVIITAIQAAVFLIVSYFKFYWSIVEWVINAVIGAFNWAKNGITEAISAAVGFAVDKFNWLKDIVMGIVDKIKGFFSGIGSAIGGAIGEAIDGIKNMINKWIITPINNVIGALNNIPGVNIGKFPYLARGTDYWQGGMAYINEGGRGELVNLPTGTQVIPHDLSKRMIDRYAKYSADNSESLGSITIQPNTTPVIINVGGKEFFKGNIETIYDIFRDDKKRVKGV